MSVIKRVGFLALVALATVGALVVGKKVLNKVQKIQAEIKRQKENAECGV